MTAADWPGERERADEALTAAERREAARRGLARTLAGTRDGYTTMLAAYQALLDASRENRHAD